MPWNFFSMSEMVEKHCFPPQSLLGAVKSLSLTASLRNMDQLLFISRQGGDSCSTTSSGAGDFIIRIRRRNGTSQSQASRPASQPGARPAEPGAEITNTCNWLRFSRCLSALLIPDQWPGLVVFNRRSDAARSCYEWLGKCGGTYR